MAVCAGDIHIFCAGSTGRAVSTTWGPAPPTHLKQEEGGTHFMVIVFSVGFAFFCVWLGTVDLSNMFENFG